MSRNQTRRFFAVIADARDRALFAVIYLYGLRVSEALALRVEDVDLDRCSLYIHRLKGGHGGERPLFQRAARLLRRYLTIRLSTGQALFTGRQGDLKRHRVYRLFKRYAQVAGLPPSFSVHSLRHSIATHLLEAGYEIEYVQDHLGHVNIQNTTVYAQFTVRLRKKVYRQVERSPEIVKV